MSHTPTIQEQLIDRRPETVAEQHRDPASASTFRGVFYGLCFLGTALVVIGVPIAVAMWTGSFLAGMAAAAAELVAFAWITKGE